jgi:hypothetical protein
MDILNHVPGHVHIYTTTYGLTAYPSVCPGISKGAHSDAKVCAATLRQEPQPGGTHVDSKETFAVSS